MLNLSEICSSLLLKESRLFLTVSRIMFKIVVRKWQKLAENCGIKLKILNKNKFYNNKRRNKKWLKFNNNTNINFVSHQ